MTNERYDPSDRDEAVSQIYREVSVETTPSHLDDRVLGNAASAARSRYGRSVRWTRPLAWALTITLTVSIIVHMAQLPVPEAPQIPPAAEPKRLEDAAVETAPRETFESDERFTPRPASAPTTMAEPAAESAVSAPRREQEARRDLAQEESALTESAAPSEAAVTMQDADMLQRASELARQQESGSAARPASRTTGLALSSKAMDPRETFCDDSERASPESWYECIERLREEGRAAAVDAELAELALAFPDFELP